MRKSLNIFSSIPYNSTIASNEQRQEHNDLATTQRAILKEDHKRSKSPQFVKLRTQMQSLTRMDMVVIEGYYNYG